MKPRNEKNAFRQRGFLCSHCDVGTQVFGEDPAPASCPNCGNAEAPMILWDHDVVQTQTVTDRQAT